MSQGAIDNRRLQRLIAQGRPLIDEIYANLGSDQLAKVHWNDLTRWQGAALKFIKETDDSLADDVTELSPFLEKTEVFGALSSTMVALAALTGAEVAQVAAKELSKDGEKPLSKSIFIVHGHDEAMKHTVARFISGLGLTPVVLHEQPDRGQTIVEKFERNAAKAGFAVVLMSPDDVGGAAATPKLKRPRARQNVVMELGYFVGTLGRSRVCVLVSKEVEIPSDYMGVAYTAFDPGGAWKLRLAGELRSAGYAIDAAGILK